MINGTSVNVFILSINSEVASKPDDSQITFDERKERVNQLCQDRLMPVSIKETVIVHATYLIENHHFTNIGN